MRDYEYLSMVVEISPQTQHDPADVEDYDKVSLMYDEGAYDEILNYMLQWDYGEDTADTQYKLDKYEEVLIETETHILAVCNSRWFGWQGDAFFLYRKEK